MVNRRIGTGTGMGTGTCTKHYSCQLTISSFRNHSRRADGCTIKPPVDSAFSFSSSFGISSLNKLSNRAAAFPSLELYVYIHIYTYIYIYLYT